MEVGLLGRGLGGGGIEGCSARVEPGRSGCTLAVAAVAVSASASPPAVAAVADPDSLDSSSMSRVSKSESTLLLQPLLLPAPLLLPPLS